MPSSISKRSRGNSMEQQDSWIKPEEYVSVARGQQIDVWVSVADADDDRGKQWINFCHLVELQEQRLFSTESASTRRGLRDPPGTVAAAGVSQCMTATSPPFFAAAQPRVGSASCAAGAGSTPIEGADVPYLKPVITNTYLTLPKRGIVPGLLRGGRSSSSSMGNRTEKLLTKEAVTSEKTPSSCKRDRGTAWTTKPLQRRRSKKECDRYPQHPREHPRGMLLPLYEKVVLGRRSRDKRHASHGVEIQQDVSGDLHVLSLPRSCTPRTGLKKHAQVLTAVHHKRVSLTHMQHRRLRILRRQMTPHELRSKRKIACQHLLQGEHRRQGEGCPQHILKVRLQNIQARMCTACIKKQPPEQETTQQMREKKQNVCSHQGTEDMTVHHYYSENKEADSLQTQLQRLYKDKLHRPQHRKEKDTQQEQGLERTWEQRLQRHGETKAHSRQQLYDKEMEKEMLHTESVRRQQHQNEEHSHQGGVQEENEQHSQQLHRQQQRAAQHLLNSDLNQQKHEQQICWQQEGQEQPKQHSVQQHLQRVPQEWHAHQNEGEESTQQLKDQQQHRAFERQNLKPASERQRHGDLWDGRLPGMRMEAQPPVFWQKGQKQQQQIHQQTQQRERQDLIRQQNKHETHWSRREEKHLVQRVKHLGQRQRRTPQQKRCVLQHDYRQRKILFLRGNSSQKRVQSILHGVVAAQRRHSKQKRENVNTQRLRVLQLIGRGAAGNVYLVEDRSSRRSKTAKKGRCSSNHTGTLYALKAIAKDNMQDSTMRRHLLVEVQVFAALQQVQHTGKILRSRERQRHQQQKELQHGYKDKSRRKLEQQHNRKKRIQVKCIQEKHRTPVEKQPRAPVVGERLQVMRDEQGYLKPRKQYQHMIAKHTRSLREDICCVRLVSCFQDAKYVYQLMEYLPGGDLRSRIDAVVSAATSATTHRAVKHKKFTCRKACRKTLIATIPVHLSVSPSREAGHFTVSNASELNLNHMAEKATAETYKGRPTCISATAKSSPHEKAMPRIKAVGAAETVTASVIAAAEDFMASATATEGSEKADLVRLPVTDTIGLGRNGEEESSASCTAETRIRATSVDERATAIKTQASARSVMGDSEEGSAAENCEEDRRGYGHQRVYMCESERKRIFAQIIWGVHTLHTLGFIHCDIKPENVAFDGTGNAKLIDFGLCCHSAPKGQIHQEKKHEHQQQHFKGIHQRQQQRPVQLDGRLNQQQKPTHRLYMQQNQGQLWEERDVSQRKGEQERGPTQQQRRHWQQIRRPSHHDLETVDADVNPAVYVGQRFANSDSDSETSSEKQASERRGRSGGDENNAICQERRVSRRGTDARLCVEAMHLRQWGPPLLRKPQQSTSICAAHPATPHSSTVTARVPTYYCALTSDVCDSAVVAVPDVPLSPAGECHDASEVDGTGLAANAGAVSAKYVSAPCALTSPSSSASDVSAATASSYTTSTCCNQNSLSLSSPCFSPIAAAGTLSYMAPEVLQRQAYSFAADWWSVGVMLFECAYGCLPHCFAARNTDVLSSSNSHACSRSLPYPPDVHAYNSSSTPQLKKLNVKTCCTSSRQCSDVHTLSTAIPWQTHLDACSNNDLGRTNSNSSFKSVLQPRVVHTSTSGRIRSLGLHPGKRSPLMVGSEACVCKRRSSPSCTRLWTNKAQKSICLHADTIPCFVPSSNVLLLSLLLRERYERGGFCPASLFYEEEVKARNEHYSQQQQGADRQTEAVTERERETRRDKEKEGQRGRGDGGNEGAINARQESQRVVRACAAGNTDTRELKDNSEERNRWGLGRLTRHRRTINVSNHYRSVQAGVRQPQWHRTKMRRHQQEQNLQQQNQLQEQGQQHVIRNVEISMWNVAVNEEKDQFKVSAACAEVMQNLLCDSSRRWGFQQLSACAWLRQFFSGSTAMRLGGQQHHRHN